MVSTHFCDTLFAAQSACLGHTMQPLVPNGSLFIDIILQLIHSYYSVEFLCNPLTRPALDCVVQMDFLLDNLHECHIIIDCR